MGGAPGAGGSASGGNASGGVSAGGSPAGGASAGGAPGAGGVAVVGGASTGGGGGLSTGGVLAAGGAATGGAVGGGTGGGAAVMPCPADATFCSGFDDAAMPDGAVFKLNGDPATPWTKYFEVDATNKRDGASALRVKSVSDVADAYKMLSVPTGGAEFWVRFYLRSDLDLGVKDHNVFAQASGSDEPNDATFVEFAEDVGLSFNSHDDVRWPEGFGRLMDGSTKEFTLAKDAWHCIELHFDGTNREQELYVAGQLAISAADYPSAAQAFTRFKFGYNALHFTARTVWYDVLAVGPTRPGCLE